MKSELEQHPEPHRFGTVSELLLDAQSRLQALDNEADIRLLGRDNNGYKNALHRQTEIVAGLSEELALCDEAAPHELQLVLAAYSGMAKRALDGGTDYGLIAFYPLGSKNDDPSGLEILAEQYRRPEN